MARVKLYEHTAYNILANSGLEVPKSLQVTNETTEENIAKFFGETPLVIKVDQGVKKRGKQGLVKVDLTPKECIEAVREWNKNGWSNFIVVPMTSHKTEEEKYLSLERTYNE